MALRAMPAPVADFDTKPFWEALAQERLLLPHCRVCDAARWPPGPICPHCWSDATDWRAAPASGRLYSWTIVRHPTHPALKDQVPYVIALADFAHKVRLLGNIVNWNGAELHDGQSVTVVYETRDDGTAIYNFSI